MMLVIKNRRGLGEQVNGPPYERIQILRATAGAKVAISNELLVEPRCAGVHKVVADPGPTRQSSPFEQASRREYPRTMTQARNRLFLAVKRAHEFAGFLRLPQEIGQPELSVQPVARVAQVRGDDPLKAEAFIQLTNQDQTGV